jgi:hypothetical protein
MVELSPNAQKPVQSTAAIGGLWGTSNGGENGYGGLTDEYKLGQLMNCEELGLKYPRIEWCC